MLIPENAHKMGALPGTIRSATVILNLVSLPAGARGLATISLADDVQFNEVEAPARFSLLGLHVARDEQVSVDLCNASDTIEPWSRWTVKREFTVRIENLTMNLIEGKSIELLLWGYPPAPTPRAENWARSPPLSLNQSNNVVSAQSAIGMPLLTQWVKLTPGAVSSGALSVGAASNTKIVNIAAGGNLQIPSGYRYIRLQGALAANATLAFPLTPNQTYFVYDETQRGGYSIFLQTPNSITAMARKNARVSI